MTHVDTGGKFYLHSATMQMGSGSGQQVVTMIEDRSSVGALWLVREGHDEPMCKPAEPIPCGGRIRLTHLETSVNLHSHLVQSPLSRQQEVSGFGSDGEGDSGDSWIVVCTNKNDKYWKRN
jgi:dolichyl-phosphate-mannose--protein O-mannosyl transferase